MSIYHDPEADAVAIEFEPGLAGYAKPLDSLRLIEYSPNPGHTIGVRLHRVSGGVELADLPNADQVKSILGALGIETR